jgi:hypothetical protein
MKSYRRKHNINAIQYLEDEGTHNELLSDKFPIEYKEDCIELKVSGYLNQRINKFDYVVKDNEFYYVTTKEIFEQTFEEVE